MLIVLALLLLAGPSPLPSAAPIHEIDIPTCSNHGDFVRVKPKTIVLPKAVVLSQEATPPGTQRDELGLHLSPESPNLDAGNLLMLQEPDYPNTGTGIRIDHVDTKTDGPHVVGHVENWISEEHTPTLDHAKSETMANTPWNENFTTAFVKFDWVKPTHHATVHYDILGLEKAVALCR